MKKKISLIYILILAFCMILTTKCFAEDIVINIGGENFIAEDADQNNEANTAIYSYKNKTLNLNNYDGGPIEYYGEDLLTIVLTGDNTITADYYSDGFVSELSDLMFTGTGSLLLQDVSNGFYLGGGNLTFNNTNICIKNIARNGIMMWDGNVTISGNVSMDDDLNKKEEEFGFAQYYQGINVGDGNISINGDISIKNAGKALLTGAEVIVESGKIDFDVFKSGISSETGFEMTDGELDINVTEEDMFDLNFGIKSYGDVKIDSGNIHIKVPDGGYTIASITDNNEEPIFDISDKLMLETEEVSLQTVSIDMDAYILKAKSIGYDGATAIFDYGYEITNAATEITIKPKITYTYTFTEGNNQEFTEKKISKYVFTIDGDFKLFKEIIIENLELEKDIDYTVKEGSTIIEFTEKGIDKLNTLNAGTYEVKVNYTNNKTAIGNLIINKDNSKPEEQKQEEPIKPEEQKPIEQEENNTNNPKTGDKVSVAVMGLILSAIGMVLTRKKLYK